MPNLERAKSHAFFYEESVPDSCAASYVQHTAHCIRINGTANLLEGNQPAKKYLSDLAKKTPPIEIQKAKSILKGFIERSGNDDEK